MGNKEEFFHHLPTGLGTQSWHNWTILLLINQAFKSQIELSGTWPRHGYYDYRKALLTRLRNIHWNHTKEVYDQTYHEKNTTFVILLECIIVTRILLIFLATNIFLIQTYKHDMKLHFKTAIVTSSSIKRFNVMFIIQYIYI